MGRKCSVFGCRTGFVVNREVVNKGTVCYGFPKDEDQCSLWVANLPNKNISVDEARTSVNMAVCALHWPENPPRMRSIRGGKIPMDPPTKFDDTGSSCSRQTVPEKSRSPIRRSSGPNIFFR